MGISTYSKTPGSNTTIGAISIAEGMSPASVNNAIRELISHIAQWAEDLSCSNTTGGSANAHTLTTDGAWSAVAETTMLLGFTSGFTSTSSVTMNVDATGAKDLKKYTSAGLTALGAGDLTVGGKYLMAYEATNEDYILLNPTTVSASDLPAGSVVASTVGTYATSTALSTTIPIDDTIPQVGEGTQIISVSHTPKSATNKLRLRFTGQVGAAEIATAVVAIFVNGGADAVAAQGTAIVGSSYMNAVAFTHEYTPGSTDAQTITVRVGGNVNIYMNGTDGGRRFGGTSAATLVVEEIKAS